LTKLADHEKVYAFSRKKNNNEVIVIINLSDSKQSLKLSKDIKGMTELFTDKKEDVKAGETLEMTPWQYKVYSK